MELLNAESSLNQELRKLINSEAVQEIIPMETFFYLHQTVNYRKY